MLNYIPLSTEKVAFLQVEFIFIALVSCLLCEPHPPPEQYWTAVVGPLWLSMEKSELGFVICPMVPKCSLSSSSSGSTLLGFWWEKEHID